jgi:hypothetical protein
MELPLGTGLLSSAVGAAMFGLGLILRDRRYRVEFVDRQTTDLLERYRVEWDRATDRIEDEVAARRKAEVEAAELRGEVAELRRRVAELEGGATVLRRNRGVQ